MIKIIKKLMLGVGLVSICGVLECGGVLAAPTAPAVVTDEEEVSAAKIQYEILEQYKSLKELKININKNEKDIFQAEKVEMPNLNSKLKKLVHKKKKLKSEKQKYSVFNIFARIKLNSKINKIKEKIEEVERKKSELKEKIKILKEKRNDLDDQVAIVLQNQEFKNSEK